MDFKKDKITTTAESLDVVNFEKDTNNIYESIAVLAKRSNQIGLDLKEELNEKVAEFRLKMIL